MISKFVPRPVDRSRTLAVAALLLLTLAVAGVLAWQGWRETRSRAALAEQLIHDYAGTAAWEFARRAERALMISITEAVLPVSQPPGSPGADATDTTGADAVRPAPPYALQPILRSFTVDAGGGELLADASGDAVARLRRAVGKQDAGFRDNLPRLLLAEQDRSLLVIGYMRLPGPAGRVAAVETTAEALATVFARVFERDPLLPPALMRGVANSLLVSVLVETASGSNLYRSSAEDHAGSAMQPLDARFGGLRVSASIKPDAVDRLVGGGLARGNSGLLISLMLLEAVLVAATLLQFRRQRELAHARTRFVAAASHELRTPLAQIRMFAETLRLGRVRSREESDRALAVIDQESQRLSTLVENILLFSRGERGNLRVTPTALPLAPFVAGVVEAFAPLARARAAQISVCEGCSSVAVLGDRDALRQVLLNLLDNAVKYGPDGQAVVVSWQTSGEAVRLFVEDEGPGVPSAERERIWEPFYRAARESGGAVAGTGIGLAVVRDLVMLQDGRAWHEARPEGGSRFVVELPLAAAKAGGPLDEPLASR